VSGEKIVPANEDELKEVAKNLITDFVGVMRLFGEDQQGQSYTAGLLTDRGDIVAVSFEHMDTVEVAYGDEAMSQINLKFMGTKGDLEIFEMTAEDLYESIQANPNLLLSSPVKLASLKIHLKPRYKPEPEPEQKGFFSGIKGMFSAPPDPAAKEERQKALKEMQKHKVEKIQGSLNLIDFARSLKMDPLKEKRFEELRKKRQPQGTQVHAASVDPKKTERLAQLKASRFGVAALAGALQAAASPASQAKQERMEALKQMRAQPEIKIEPPKEDKTPVSTVKEGKKVETSIDKFYALVEQQGRVKLNDALAARLRTSKTQIEEWAMILEEHSLLELRYPTIGEPEIISTKAEKAGKKEDQNARKK
jgi:hypothetical protein